MAVRRDLIVLSAVSLLVGAFGGAIATKAGIAADPTNAIAQNTTPPSGSGQECRGQGPRGHRRPDFAAAAQRLGVTEAQLTQALGVPAEPPALDENGRPAGRPPRPDFAAAAQQLGVTEEQLIEALGVPRRPPGDRQGSGQGNRPNANQQNRPSTNQQSR